ncbi:MAG: sulfurtransferase [Chloroflexota bacterium]|nr:sulfurtransferase [Dehalococcoidia bacterium]MDW8252743.1 sulfurtransferase [Chloroflexota bacterium]
MTDPRGMLVDVSWVRERLHDPQLRLLDVRKPAEFEAGHLPGAVNVDIYDLHWWDSSPEGLPGFRRQHEQAFGAAGLSRDHTIVVYGQTTDMLAARALWVLKLFGHPRAYLLDGGIAAWQESGGALERGPVVPAPADYRSEWHPEILAGWPEVRAAIGKPGTVLLDTRSREEYTGTLVRSKHGGAIPGAIHLEFSNNIGPDGRLKSPDELAALYRARGVTPDKEVIAYCHGGYRAAHTWLALTVAGYPRVKNYVSSWGEWGNRDDLPIERPSAQDDPVA